MFGDSLRPPATALVPNGFRLIVRFRIGALLLPRWLCPLAPPNAIRPGPTPHRSASPTQRRVAALLVLASACSLDRSGISIGQDAGVRPDASVARPDTGPEPDAGPPCLGFSEDPSVVANIGPDRFTATDTVSIDGTPPVMELSVNRDRYGAWKLTGYESALTAPPDLASLDEGSRRDTKFIDTNELSALDGGNAPRGLGLADDHSFTLLFEGELFLDASRDVTISSLDGAIMVLDAPGGAITLVAPEGGEEATSAIAVPAGGAWVPIQAAAIAREEDWGFYVRVDGSEVEPSRIRVRADDLAGRHVVGFDTVDLRNAAGDSRIDPSDTARVEYRDDDRPEIGVEDRNSWRIVWNARAFLETARGVVDSQADDDHALFVDGIYHGGDALGVTTASAGTGWHDFVLVLEEGSGPAWIFLDYDQSPLATFRPYLGSGGFAIGNGTVTRRSLNGTPQSVSLELGDVELKMQRAVATVEVIARDPSMVAVKWMAPDRTEAASYTLTGAEPIVGAANRYRHRRTFDVSGMDPDGNWTIDVQSGTTGDLFEAAGLLLQEAPAPRAHPANAAIVSEPVRLADETEISHVYTIGDVPPSTQVSLRVRGAASTSALAVAPWVVVGIDGALASPVRAHVMSVEVTLDGPGDLTPHVEELRVLGRRCDRCAPACPLARVRDGLRHLYTFEDAPPTRARDEAANGRPIDLYLIPPPMREGTTMLDGDSLVIRGQAGGMRTAEAMTHLASGTGFTIEAWLTCESDMSGPGMPSRIVTLSGDESNHNFMLGREGASFSVRMRTTTFASPNGDPLEGFASVVEGTRQHVVVTHDGTSLVWYVDGVQVHTMARGGAYTNWDPSYPLYVGNERLAARPFQGALHLVAVYDRALSAAEVMRNRDAGE